MSTGNAGPGRPGRARRAALVLLAALVWTVLVCYPNPSVLMRNILRYRHLPVDPGLAKRMGWSLPRQPRDIESFVENLLAATPDWELYRVPWYVPTPAEAIRAGQGDCESKTVVLASLLAGKGIAFEVRASLSHIWVDYPGRRPRPGESKDSAYLEGKPGRLGLHWPQRVDLRVVWEGPEAAALGGDAAGTQVPLAARPAVAGARLCPDT